MASGHHARSSGCRSLPATLLNEFRPQPDMATYAAKMPHTGIDAVFLLHIFATQLEARGFSISIIADTTRASSGVRAASMPYDAIRQFRAARADARSIDIYDRAARNDDSPSKYHGQCFGRRVDEIYAQANIFIRGSFE